ncbi:hypothetical protein METP3_01253 [Methanosarcinales archaeon]|nr:hypothetical protein METP3_01253 [Methanosarcinales archaeon]
MKINLSLGSLKSEKYLKRNMNRIVPAQTCPVQTGKPKHQTKTMEAFSMVEYNSTNKEPSDKYLDNIPVPRGRCHRCRRPIKIRYAGQIYGPVCLKKVKAEELNNSPEPQSPPDDQCVVIGWKQIDANVTRHARR